MSENRAYSFSGAGVITTNENGSVASLQIWEFSVSVNFLFRRSYELASSLDFHHST